VTLYSLLTDPKGDIVSSYQYDSFGNLTDSTGSISNPFLYTGREFDIETGLYFYRARYYDPSIGRFISEDPIQFKGGNNFYIYVQNNPVNFIDPDGLQEVWFRIVTRFSEAETALDAVERASRDCKTQLDDKVDEWIAMEKAAMDMDGNSQMPKKTGSESNKWQHMLDMLPKSKSTIETTANKQELWE
jgi:RHS repeat-associated protein